MNTINDKMEEIKAVSKYTHDNNLDNMQKKITSLQKLIALNNSNIIHNTKLINEKDKELQDKITRTAQQEKEIEYKKKLIATRNRMLQLSQEKNVYKKKVIYSLLSIIILFIIIMIVIYVYFNK